MQVFSYTVIIYGYTALTIKKNFHLCGWNIV